LDVLKLEEEDNSQNVEDEKEMRKFLLQLEHQAMTRLLYAPYIINGISTLAQLDSGCDSIIIDHGFCKQHQIAVQPQEGLITLGNNTTANIVGVATIQVAWRRMDDNKKVEMTAYVMENSAHDSVTFGFPSFSILGIQVVGAPVMFPSEERDPMDMKSEIDELLIPVTDDFRQTTLEDENDADAYIKASLVRREDQLPADQLEIILKTVNKALDENSTIGRQEFCNHDMAQVALSMVDDNPVFTSPYNIPIKLRSLVDEKLGKLRDCGVIKRMLPGGNWNSPLTVALKKDEDGRIDPNKPVIRLCLDTRKLNAKLKDMNYRIPLIADLFSKLHGASILSILDIEDAYHQVRIREEDVEKLTFRWNGQPWAFCRAPFGLKIMVSYFQSLMEILLQEMIDQIIVYLDDIVVFTKMQQGQTMNDILKIHAASLVRVITTLTKFQVRVNRKKCRIGYIKIRILGHILSGSSRNIDPEKYRVLSNYPIPTTGKTVMSFLGFCNYLRDYVPLYSELAAPLEKLRNKQKISAQDWTEECQQSFTSFQQILLEAPVLKFPLDGYPYEVWTDASATGVGAALVQNIHEETRYIMFASRALNSGQIHYSATRRELLAVVFALQRFKEYLYMTKFTILTDHRALTFMLTQSHLNNMLNDWLEVILEFDFTIHHLPGILNQLCDSLSRAYPPFMWKRRQQHRQELETKFHATYRTMTVNEFVKYPESELIQFIRERFEKKCPTKAERLPLVRKVHAKGHFGIENAFKQLWMDGYFWTEMRTDCAQEIARCMDCLRYNVGKRNWHLLNK
jgi:hypothetical protein